MTADADAALFRVRAFEADWVSRLHMPEQPLVSAALLQEAHRWITAGREVGYFAAGDTGGCAVTAQDPRVEEILEVGARDGFEDDAAFVEALVDAQDDLTPARREYLHLLLFADDASWDAALRRFKRYVRVTAEARGEERPIPAESLRWAMRGAASTLKGEPHSPAYWRSDDFLQGGLAKDRFADLEAVRQRLWDEVMNTDEVASSSGGRLRILSDEASHESTSPARLARLELLATLRRAYERYFNAPTIEGVQRLSEASTNAAMALGWAAEQPRIGAASGGGVGELSVWITQVREPDRQLALAHCGFRRREIEDVLVSAERALQSSTDSIRRSPIAAPESAASVLEATLAQTIYVFIASTDLPRRQKRRLRGVVRDDANRQVLIAALQAIDDTTHSSEFDAALRFVLTGAPDDPRRRILSPNEMGALRQAVRRYRWDPWTIENVLGVTMQRAAEGGDRRHQLVTIDDWVGLRESVGKR